MDSEFLWTVNSNGHFFSKWANSSGHFQSMNFRGNFSRILVDIFYNDTTFDGDNNNCQNWTSGNTGGAGVKPLLG